MVKKMKNGYLASLVFISLIAFGLSGCNSNSGESDNSNVAFAGGTNGLLISWVQPSYDSNILLANGQSELGMVLEIKNDGEYQVQTGEAILKLAGIYPSDFGLDDDSVSFDSLPMLYPKRKDLEGNILEGSTELFSFNDKVLCYQGSIKGISTANLVAELCYKYVTYASGDLCVGSTILNTGGRSDSVCDTTGVRPFSSSGAPVQVTSFRQEAAGKNKIMLHFTIEHKGNGNIYKYDNVNNLIECNPNKMTNYDNVLVKIGEPGSDFWHNLKCGSASALNGVLEKNIRLSNGKGFLDCTLELKSDTRNYIKSVPLTIEYLYSTSTSVPLIIKETIGDDSVQQTQTVTGTATQQPGTAPQESQFRYACEVTNCIVSANPCNTDEVEHDTLSNNEYTLYCCCQT